MKPRNRSLSGALIAVFTLPVFMGLLACIPSFPVPIGDPEKSTIDPDITGWWMAGEMDETHVYLFDAFDDRSWLLSIFVIEADSREGCDFDDGAELVDPDDPDFSGLYATRIAAFDQRSDCFSVGYGGYLKAWQTKLGGDWFMTWEPRMFEGADSRLRPEEWMVLRIDKSNADYLLLRFLSAGDEIFDVIDTDNPTRRQFERVIRKHARKRGFVDDDDYGALLRVQDADVGLIVDLVDEFIVF